MNPAGPGPAAVPGADPAAVPGPTGRTGLLRQSGLGSLAAALGILTGLLLDVVIAADYGAGRASDAFFVGARIPLGLTVLVLASSTHVLVPTFRLWITAEGRAGASRLTGAVLTGVVGAALAVAVLGVATAQVVVDLTAPGLDEPTRRLAASVARPMFLLVPLVAAAEVLRSLLNATFSILVPAAMHVVVNVVAATVVLAVPGTDPRTIVVGYLAGSALQLVVMAGQVRRRGFRLRPGSPWGQAAVRAAGGRAARTLSSSGLQLVARVLEQALVSFLPSGSVTVVNYASRLTAAIGGGVFFRSVVVALLPRLTDAHARGDDRDGAATLGLGVRVMLGLSLPMTAALAALGPPAAVLLFRRGQFDAPDARLLGVLLAVYSLSLVGAALQRALLAAFTSRLDTSTFLRNTAYGVLANVLLLIALVAVLGRDGERAAVAVPIAYVGAQAVNVLHAAWRVRRGLGVRLPGAGSFGLRVALASLLAAVAMTGTGLALGAYDAHRGAAELALGLALSGAAGALMLAAALGVLAGRELRRSLADLRSRAPTTAPTTAPTAAPTTAAG